MRTLNFWCLALVGLCGLMVPTSAKAEIIPAIQTIDSYIVVDTTTHNTYCKTQGQYNVIDHSEIAPLLSDICPQFIGTWTGYDRELRDNCVASDDAGTIGYAGCDVWIAPQGSGNYSYSYGQDVASWHWVRQTYYTCPATHPTEIDEDNDGFPEFCESLPCNCDENWDSAAAQCVTRTPIYGDQPQEGPGKKMYLVSDPNNEGLKCGVLAPEGQCDGDAQQSPIPWIQNPINCLSGAKLQSETDYNASVGGIGLTRTYVSTGIEKDTYERVVDVSGSFPSDVQFRQQFANVSMHEWEIEGLPYLDIDTSLSGVIRSTFKSPSGKRTHFTRAASGGAWKSLRLRDGSLTDDGNSYSYTSLTGTLYEFDLQGRLTKKTYRNGQYLNVTYPSNTQAVLTDNFGRTASFTYAIIPINTATNKRVITSFVDPAGNAYSYQHDNKGYITKVTYPDTTPANSADNPYKEYQYSDRSFTKVLVAVKDERGNQYATYDYDNKNRAISTEHAGGAIKATVDYLDDTALNQSAVRFYRDETNYREVVYHHKHINQVDKVTKLDYKPCNDCTVGTFDYQYGEDGFLEQSTSTDGGIEKFSYNARGLLTSHTQAFGTAEERTTTTSWHGQYNIPLSVDESLRLTTNSYDVNGNLLFRTVKDKATNETRTITYTYNQWGQVLTVDGPRTDVSDVTSYEYNASGNLTKVTNSLGHQTLITSHDAHGNPLSITDPNGTVTSMTYHPRGWLTSTTIDGDTTSYSYDVAGLLTQVVMANGIALSYEYDAAQRMKAIVDGQGNRIEYSLDHFGNSTRTDIKDSSGTIQSYATQVYNNLGQLKRSLGANSQIDKLNYDAEGKQTSAEDPLNHVTSSHYDALDRLQKVVDPAQGETEFGYDAQDQLTSVTDATNKTTSYQYNAFGEVTSQTSPDTGTSSFTYDKAGNLLSATDARSITVSYAYDALNRMTSISYPNAAENVSFIYDNTSSGNGSQTGEDGRSGGASNEPGIGRLTGITDQSGSTEYKYDAKGQLIQETRTIGNVSFISNYEYDAAGLLTQMTYPSGRTVDYNRNSLGQVTSLSTYADGRVQTVASNISYLPFGPLKSLTFGNGKLLSQNFDQDYRLTSKVIPGVTDLNYGYTLRNNINSIADALDNNQNQSFQYDNLGRLTDATGAYGDQDYSFDAIGNRLTKIQDGASESYQYDTLSHRLTQVANTNLTYDAIGNTLTKGELSFAYNQAGRLSSANKTGMSASYLYNALGQRVKKVVATQGGGGAEEAPTQEEPTQEEGSAQEEPTQEEPTQDQDPIEGETPPQEEGPVEGDGQDPVGEVYSSQTRLYHYDQAGQLIAQTDENGNILQEYIYMDGMRLANVQQNKVYYVHTDHLGSPVALTDAAGTVQWKGSYDPYGKVTVQVNNLTQNIRFPGQILDSETDMHYNYFRDYDPEIGRYLQSDPIGLNGGINTYGYVGANPVNGKDPLGLACIASNGTVTCQAPNGGPLIQFPQPKGWPKEFNENSWFYHVYNINLNGYVENANKRCLEEYIRNNPTPGSNPSRATVKGAKNNATPSLAEENISNPVISYYTTDLQTGEPVIVNVTQPGHKLWPGYVARTVSNHSNGKGLVLNNFGEGTGFMQNELSWTQFPVNSSWIGLNRDAKKACSCPSE